MEEQPQVYRLDEHRDGRFSSCIIRVGEIAKGEELRVECGTELAGELVLVLNKAHVSTVNFKEVARDWLYQKIILPVEAQFS